MCQWSDSSQSGSLATNVVIKALISYGVIVRDDELDSKKEK